MKIDLARGLLALALCAPPLFGGCLAQGEKGPPPPANDDEPRSLGQARQLEDRGLDALRAGNRSGEPERRRELYDQALADFRAARALLEDELLRDPGPPERERYLKSEIERLSQAIEDVHRNRPAG